MFSKSKMYFAANGDFVNNKDKNIIETFDFDDTKTYVIQYEGGSSKDNFVKFNDDSSIRIVPKDEAHKFKEIKMFDIGTDKHFLVPVIDGPRRGNLSVLIIEGDNFKLNNYGELSNDYFNNIIENFSSKLGIKKEFISFLPNAILDTQISIDNPNTGVSELVNENGLPISIRSYMLNLFMKETSLYDMTRENADVIFNDFINAVRVKMIDSSVNYPNDSSTILEYKIVEINELTPISMFTQESRYTNTNNLVQDTEIAPNMNPDIASDIRKCINKFNGLTLKELDNLPDDLKIQLAPYIAHLQD